MKNYGGSCGANLNFKGRERLAVMMEMEWLAVATPQS